MACVEQRNPFRHCGIGGDDGPDDIAFQCCDRRAVHGRYARESIEVVVDENLTRDPHNTAIGLDAVALFGLGDRATFELAAFADLQQLRRLANLHPVHRLEVGGQNLTTEGHESAGVDVVGLA